MIFQCSIELQRSGATTSLRAIRAISLLQDCACVVGLSSNNTPLRLQSEINYYYYYQDPLYYNLHGEIDLRYTGLEVLVGFHSTVDLLVSFFSSIFINVTGDSFVQKTIGRLRVSRDLLHSGQISQ